MTNSNYVPFSTISLLPREIAIDRVVIHSGGCPAVGTSGYIRGRDGEKPRSVLGSCDVRVSTETVIIVVECTGILGEEQFIPAGGDTTRLQLHQLGPATPAGCWFG